MRAIPGHSYRVDVPLPYLSPRELFALLAEHRGALVADAAVDCLLDQLDRWKDSESLMLRADMMAALAQMHAEHGNFSVNERAHFLSVIADAAAPARGNSIPGFPELHQRMILFMHAVCAGEGPDNWKEDPEANRYREIWVGLKAEVLEELREPELARLLREQPGELNRRSNCGEAELFAPLASSN